MKGLLLKDMYMIRNGCLQYLFVIGIMIILTFISNDKTYLFFTIYSIVFSSMLTVTLLAYDERGHWDIYCDTLPVTRKTAVVEKYTLTYAVILTVWLLSSLSRLVNLSLAPDANWSEYITFAFTALAIGVIYPAVFLPAIFKLGTQKGRIISIVTVITACSCASLIYFFITDFKTILTASAVIAIIILPLSCLLSIKFYSDREL